MKKYLVGGAVRNLLLKLPVTEKDWLVIGATPEEMLNIGYQKVGKDFPVFIHPTNHEEYALARIEKKSGKGYYGFTCYTSPEITLKEDLHRRDLTINAIACDEQGNIIDPYKGMKDIKLKILRHVSILFKEDPLRVLRVARFSATLAHLNFKIAPETLKLMKEMIQELSLISPERIWTETKKALMTKNPQIYFKVLKNCGALQIIFPEINNLFNNNIKLYTHNLKINIGHNSMKALKISVNLTTNLNIRFAILCNNFGKITTIQNKYKQKKIKSSGIKIINNLCKRLKIPNNLNQIAKMTNKYQETLYNIHLKKPNKIIQFFNKIDIWRHPERLEQMLIINEIHLRSIKKFEYQNYKQKTFLRSAYNLTKNINITKIINRGFTKEKIKKEINVQRQKLIFIWKITRK